MNLRTNFLLAVTLILFRPDLIARLLGDEPDSVLARAWLDPREGVEAAAPGAKLSEAEHCARSKFGPTQAKPDPPPEYRTRALRPPVKE